MFTVTVVIPTESPIHASPSEIIAPQSHSTRPWEKKHTQKNSRENDGSQRTAIKQGLKRIIHFKKHLDFLIPLIQTHLTDFYGVQCARNCGRF